MKHVLKILLGGWMVLAGQLLPAQTQPFGDAARGKEIFERRCTGCHTLDQNREGPMLRNVFGRTAGSVKGFEYSEALKKSQLVWDEQTLEKWLSNPDELVPGNNMGFRMAKPQERQDLIRFLRVGAQK
jgi:cytochrome c